MSTTSSPRMTLAEFTEWVNRAENAASHWELDEGRLIETPMPPSGHRHGLYCWLVAHCLVSYLFSRGEGYILTNDSGFIVSKSPATVRGPDLMLYLDRLNSAQMCDRWTSQPPQLIVEIFSLTKRVSRLSRRVKQYHEAGVPLVEVIYPEENTLQVWRPGQLPEV